MQKLLLVGLFIVNPMSIIIWTQLLYSRGSNFLGSIKKYIGFDKKSIVLEDVRHL